MCLKLSPTPLPTAYNHHNFQSDNRKAKRTNAKNRSERGGFCYIRVEYNKVRFSDSRKQQFFFIYRTFLPLAKKLDKTT